MLLPVGGTRPGVTSATRSLRCRTSRSLYFALQLGHTLTWNAPRAVARVLTYGVPSAVLGCSLIPDPASDDTLHTFCFEPGYTGLGYAAFTDGTGFERSVCGFAAVVCRMEDFLNPAYRFEEGTYVVLKGTAPLAGANYAAEVKALLAVLHAIPINAPLFCVSDALSALQVLWKPTVANGARLRL